MNDNVSFLSFFFTFFFYFLHLYSFYLFINLFDVFFNSRQLNISYICLRIHSIHWLTHAGEKQKIVQDDTQTRRVPVDTVVHYDTHTSVLEGVKDSNQHVIIISVISGIWTIKTDVQRAWRLHKIIIQLHIVLEIDLFSSILNVLL